MKKYYAVKVGRKPGIYTSWPEAEAQVKGYPVREHPRGSLERKSIWKAIEILRPFHFAQGALHKAFKTLPEAEAYLGETGERASGKRMRESDQSRQMAEASTSSSAMEGCYTLYFDGGARGNPGPGGAGAVLIAPDGKYIARISQWCGEGSTNNEAEYKGLIAGLQEAMRAKQGPEGLMNLEVMGDSNLCIKQMRGEWRVSSPKLTHLHNQAAQLAQELDVDITFKHVPRESNTAADELANQALDSQQSIADRKKPKR